MPIIIATDKIPDDIESQPKVFTESQPREKTFAHIPFQHDKETLRFFVPVSLSEDINFINELVTDYLQRLKFSSYPVYIHAGKSLWAKRDDLADTMPATSNPLEYYQYRNNIPHV